MKAKIEKKLKKVKRLGLVLMILSGILFLLDMTIFSYIENYIIACVWISIGVLGIYLKEILPIFIEGKENKRVIEKQKSK